MSIDESEDKPKQRLKLEHIYLVLVQKFRYGGRQILPYCWLRPWAGILTWNTVIHRMCKQGRMKEAARLHRDMVVAGVEPNTVVYVYCWVGDVGEAFRLQGEMEARGMLLSVATDNAVIWNLWDGNMKEINGLLNEMDERKVQADNVTCNTLINSYSKTGYMASKCKVKRRMVESGLQLDQFAYEAPIHGFCKGTQLDEAKDALFEMMSAGFSPNFSLYSWLIDAFYKKNNTDVALLIPDEPMKRGRPPDESVQRSLIQRLCKKGLVDLEQKVLNQMQGKGRSSFVQTYDCVFTTSASAVLAAAVSSSLCSEWSLLSFREYREHLRSKASQDTEIIIC